MVKKVVIMKVEFEVHIGSNYDYTYTVLKKRNTFVYMHIIKLVVK